jgi:archaellum biogenesis ATPase FlaH
MTAMPDFDVEPLPREAAQAEPVPPQPAPAKAAELAKPPTITNVAQLPSIWTLEANIEWLIDGLIPLGSLNLITSESGTGKTWVAYAIAGAVARGEAFAGLAVKQRPVLYLDGENPLCVAKQRLWDLGIAETPDLRVWGGWVDDPPHGPGSALLRDYARQHRPLLIWDSLVQFHDGDEQSAKETRAFMKHFRQLAHAGATILILHHTGKTATSQEYRGSSDIKAAVDMAYLLETESTLMGRIHRLTLRNFKSRFAPEKDFGLEFVHRQGFVACDVPEKGAAADAMPIITDIVAGNPGNNQAQIVALAQRGGISKHQVEKCLRDGPFKRQRGNRNEWLYSLAVVQLPNLPAPIEEGNREIEPAPAEVVA